jgi:hypothetical protein
MPEADKQIADPLAQPLFNMDPTKLAEAAGKMNFVGAVNPELAQKALAGDPQALQALLNQGAQQSFVASMTTASKMVEEAISKNNARFEEALPSRIRSHQINTMESTNPVLNHPAAQPLLKGMTAQIAAANPHLNADQVRQAAEGYVLAMHKDMNAATAAETAKNQKPTGPDFSSFLPDL